MAATLLHLAVFDGDDTAVNRLLAKGVDVNARTYYGDTPLMLAALWGYIPIVHTLLKWGADIDAVPHEGRSALRHAIREGHTEIVALLLARGANPAAVPPPGWVTEEERKKARREAWKSLQGLLMAETLLGTRRFASKFFMRCLRRTWEGNFWQKKLEKLDAPFKNTQIELLQLALLSRNADTLRLLLEQGYFAKANADKSPYSLLGFAQEVKSGAECVKLLLDYGDTLDYWEDSQSTPLEEAVLDRDTELARVYLDAGVSTDTGDKATLLMVAIHRQDESTLELLLKHGLRLRKRDASFAFSASPAIKALLDRYHDAQWWESTRTTTKEELLAYADELQKKEAPYPFDSVSILNSPLPNNPKFAARVCDRRMVGKDSECRRFLLTKYRDVMEQEILHATEKEVSS